jgi:3,4-dihydroxy 2-butanone 4-phosphate synthase/GTP cyclohydrolase II
MDQGRLDGQRQHQPRETRDSPLVQHQLELREIGEATVSLLPEDEGEALAFTYGLIGGSTLVRLQSRCTYGEVFASAACDCRDQLDAAWGKIVGEGAGVIIYLDQEGRGAGAVAKARAHFDHERLGIDTFESYRRQGISADERHYDAASRLLSALGIRSMRLLTNNPEKVRAMSSAGFDVTRQDIVVQPSTSFENYLDAKRRNGYFI